MNAKRSEKGQVLVLIILAVVGLFAFAALAVDMGQIFLARRSAQAAADAAALAAAMDFSAGSNDQATALSKGIAMAATNGYNNDGTTNVVQALNPPDVGPYSAANNDDADEYFMVRIAVTMEPIFTQFFYSGGQTTTVEAVARAKPSVGVSGEDAMLAVSTGDDALDLKGNVTVIIEGGNMRSNGSMSKKGGSGGVTIVSPGKVFYAVGFDGHTGPFTDAQPEQSPAVSLFEVPAPYCPTKNETHNGVNYYYHGSGLSGKTNLAPGIHCVKGGIDKGDYTGNGVLIVLLTGGIKQTGGDSLDFRAAQNLVDKNGNQYGGMVLYAPISNTSELKFGGNSGAYFQGTLYTPGAYCNIGGTEDGSAYHAAFICDHFKFHGNPVFRIDYKAEELNRLKPSVELVQ